MHCENEVVINMKNFNSHNYEYARFCEIKPSLSCNEGDDFVDWQNIAKEKLTELLGLPQCRIVCVTIFRP